MPWDENEAYEVGDRVSINGDNQIVTSLVRGPLKRQCMTLTTTLEHPAPTQCPNEAWFTVGFLNGEAQDVCRSCLLVACDSIGERQVIVMRVKPRHESNSYRVDL